MKIFFRNCILILCFLFTSTLAWAEGGDLGTTDLVKATIKAIPHCMHYRIVGTCFWLQCVGVYCRFTATLKLDHYVPDTLVTVFHNDDSDPYNYAQLTIDKAAKLAGKTIIKAEYHAPMGTGDQSISGYKNKDTHFKEVDVIGNPAAQLLGFDIFLNSATTPFFPYYSSMLDAASWRSGMLEMLYPGSLIPGMHDVGSFPLNVWGNIYPRTGFLNQPEEAKAAAVIAQRAVDIVTKSNQPHIYKSLSHSCGVHCDVMETHENNDDTQFQMVYPDIENTCAAFGKNDVLNPTPWHSAAMSKSNGDYAWLMWRHYHGCIQGEGHYVGSLEF